MDRVAQINGNDVDLAKIIYVGPIQSLDFGGQLKYRFFVHFTKEYIYSDYNPDKTLVDAERALFVARWREVLNSTGAVL